MPCYAERCVETPIASAGATKFRLKEQLVKQVYEIELPGGILHPLHPKEQQPHRSPKSTTPRTAAQTVTMQSRQARILEISLHHVGHKSLHGGMPPALGEQVSLTEVDLASQT